MTDDVDRPMRPGDPWTDDAPAGAPVLLIAADPWLRCTAVGGDIAAAIGWRTDASDGRRIADLVGDGTAGKAVVQRFEEALRGATVPVEWRGGGRVLLGTVAPQRGAGDTVVGAVAALVDVTERADVEQSLQDALARERELVARLRDLDELKNAFLQAVSHELRTPLTALRGFAATLSSSGEDLSPLRRRAVADRLVANAEKLERMLTDLLDVDRLSRGIVEPQRRLTDVAGLVARVVAETDLSGRSVGVELDPVTIHVDAPKIERIVENLLANAVKHTPDGTRLHVAVRQHALGMQMTVAQDDVAIPDELKQVIFEPFRQGPARHPHAPGTGIGLSLVARFAELHGGRTWVEDRPDGGAAFCVFIPDELPER